MGSYYWFGNKTRKEYIKLPGSKQTEIKSDHFSCRMITQFVMKHGDSEYTFLSDESGAWDRVTEEEWKDYTVDVLIDMFEDGFKPSRWEFGWIYAMFDAAHRMKDLSEWLPKWDGDV